MRNQLTKKSFSVTCIQSLVGLGVYVLFAVIFGCVTITSAASTCAFTTTGSEMVLDADCTTDVTILIPNGMTLEGNSHTITAVNPASGPFLGAVVMNGGEIANVTNLKIDATLSSVCYPYNPPMTPDFRLRGILFQGASGSVTSSEITNIKRGTGNGCQEGNAIEVRNFGHYSGTNSVTIDGNTVSGYQKTGIVANGDVTTTITNNVVTGFGPASFIAQNGIQVGFGGTGMVKRNTVSGNSYTGSSTSSGGVLVVGGPGYGGEFCVGVQVMQNTIRDNDVGVYISQYEMAPDYLAPATATNIKVVNNVISNSSLNNSYVYQAGVSDVGNNDKIINNQISGAGYDPATSPGGTFYVDADPSFTNRAKVHANK